MNNILHEARELLKGISKWPWAPVKTKHPDGRLIMGVNSLDECNWVVKISENTKRTVEHGEANMNFIARSPQLVADLISHIERQEKRIAKLKEVLATDCIYSCYYEGRHPACYSLACDALAEGDE